MRSFASNQMTYGAKIIFIELYPWNSDGARGQEGPPRLVAVIPPGVSEEDECRDEYDQEGREKHFVTQMVLVSVTNGWMVSLKQVVFLNVNRFGLSHSRFAALTDRRIALFALDIPEPEAANYRESNLIYIAAAFYLVS